jgi:5'(3')-deoxyribonucleotidase
VKLNNIIAGFRRTIIRLDKLIETNDKKVEAFVAATIEIDMETQVLNLETDKAAHIAINLRNLIGEKT